MEKQKSDQEAGKAFNEAAADPAGGQALSALSEKLRKAIFGQEEAVAAVMKSVTSQRNSPLIMMGPSSVGKTEMAKRLAEKLFGRDPNRGYDTSIIFDEPVKTTSDETRAALHEALHEAMARPSGRKLGELAAQACHDGLTEKIVPLKPIQLKRGFAYIM